MKFLDRMPLQEAVLTAFKNGPPNGWLLGWSQERHFASFSALIAPGKAQNLTSFDYAFCNRFESRVDDLDDGEYAVLAVLLSFVCDVCVKYWTVYERGGRVGRVVSTPPSTGALALDSGVANWLTEIGFVQISADLYDAEIGGIELELSGSENVTLGKCLFEDSEG